MENEITRRIRDYDTGEISYVTLSTRSDAGSGFFTNVASKLTGKTASKLASKAAEELIEKGSEKVGEKNGEVIGEKILISFLRSKKINQLKHMKRKEKKLLNISKRKLSLKINSSLLKTFIMIYYKK